MKKILLFVCVCFPVFMFGQSVAYVYADSLLLSVPGYSKNVMKIDSLQKTLEKELETTKIGINQKYGMLIKPYAPKESENVGALKARMSAVDTLSLNLIIEDIKQLEVKKQAYDRILQTSYNKDVQPILDRISKEIADFARLNKITMVFVVEQMKQTLAYIDPKQNITGSIKSKLKGKQ